MLAFKKKLLSEKVDFYRSNNHSTHSYVLIKSIFSNKRKYFQRLLEPISTLPFPHHSQWLWFLSQRKLLKAIIYVEYSFDLIFLETGNTFFFNSYIFSSLHAYSRRSVFSISLNRLSWNKACSDLFAWNTTLYFYSLWCLTNKILEHLTKGKIS